MIKTVKWFHARVQLILTSVPERWVAHIVRQRHGLSQVLIQPQRT